MSIMATGSFRGASFYVRNIRDRNIGRQIAVHQYPNQKSPYIEDLGLKTFEVEFEAFVSTDSNLYMSRDLLEAALRTKGLGELLHPTRGMFRAACLESEFAEEVNQLGLVLVRLLFICATMKPQVPMTPLALVDTQGDLLSDAFSGLGDIGSSLGPLGSSLVSTAVSVATSAVTSAAIGGIDSIFTHSTTGRYSQSYTESTEAIINGTNTNTSSTNSSDRDKFNAAKQIAIQTVTNGSSALSKAVSAINGD